MIGLLCFPVQQIIGFFGEGQDKYHTTAIFRFVSFLITSMLLATIMYSCPLDENINSENVHMYFVNNQS